MVIPHEAGKRDQILLADQLIWHLVSLFAGVSTKGFRTPAVAEVSDKVSTSPGESAFRKTKCQVIYLEMSAPPGWVVVKNSSSRLRRVKCSGLAQFDTRWWV